LSATVVNAEFSDVSSGDYYFDAIDWMEENQIVEGYDDGTYRPFENINRAEFLKIVMEAVTPEYIGGHIVLLMLITIGMLSMFVGRIML